MLLSLAAQNKTACLDWYEKLGFLHTQIDDNLSVVYDAQFSLILDHKISARTSFIVDELPKSEMTVKRVGDQSYSCSPMGILVREDSVIGSNKRHDSAAGLGTFYGYAIECFDIIQSYNFWKNLGYRANEEPSASTGFLPLSKSGATALTLFAMGQCPHKFVNPSLTFFNGKEGNKLVLNNLRELGITFAEEITHFNEEGHVDNAIVADPTGLHCFLFNDG